MPCCSRSRSPTCSRNICFDEIACHSWRHRFDRAKRPQDRRQVPDRFAVKVLTAKNNVDRLAGQIQAFEPEAAVVYDAPSAQALAERLPRRWKIEILHGPEGYRAAAQWPGTDMVVAAMVGAAGLAPTMAAIDAGKDIAWPTRKPWSWPAPSSLPRGPQGRAHFAGGQRAQRHFSVPPGPSAPGPGQDHLTASGGPFLKTPAREFGRIGPEQALKHPNWQMGAKITIDSATLMNKGLEVIEAKWLFDLTPDQIEVLVHPQSIVHSMVAFCDGTVIAQLGIPDMQGAIAYALSHPRRLALGQPLPDLAALGALTFEPPDLPRFPCLALAFEACRAGGTLPAVLNAANEVAVEAFLSGRLSFPAIYQVIRATMAAHSPEPATALEGVLSADARARRTAQGKVEELAVI
jgi:1-deoxy-D-xylulose-5-phosphate reductoisomerase